jgi:predicted Zn-ribbon and HTH transcriptional regulator
MPDYFTVTNCRNCGAYFRQEELDNSGLCISCDNDPDDFNDDDEDDYHSIDPNVCSDCGSDTVQVQNGAWVLPKLAS